MTQTTNVTTSRRRGGIWRHAGIGAIALGVMMASGGAWADDDDRICQPDKLYDVMSASFHQSFALRNNDTWTGWGEHQKGGVSNGNRDAILSPSEFDTYIAERNLPRILLLTTGSSGVNHEAVALTEGGLYVWGRRGYVVPTSRTNNVDTAPNHLKVTTTGSDYGLPQGVVPKDVAQLFAINGVLTLVTKIETDSNGNYVGGGYAYVMGSQATAQLLGDGSASNDGEWHQVKDTLDNALTKVIGLRGHRESANRNALMALTLDGKAYTWGNSVYLGDNSAMQDSSNAPTKATEMTLPHGSEPSVGLPKMIAVTGDSNGPTYFVLYDSGKLFGLGENSRRQVGNRDNQDTREWAAVKRPDSTDFTNVRFISVQEHNGGSNNLPAALLIDNDDILYTWGGNDGFDVLDRSHADHGNNAGCFVNGGSTSCDPGIPHSFNARSDKARTAELGGHTMMYLPKGSAKFCYVGHKINGSMGDDTTGSSSSGVYSFNCTTTPAVNICGSTAISADDDDLGSTTVPDIAKTINKSVFENDELADAPLYMVGVPQQTLIDRLTLTVDTPATPINWGPVPVLEMNKTSSSYGKVTVPAGTPPGDYTITYKICETEYGNEICDTADAKVTVLGIKAIPDTDSTLVDTPVTTKVTDNDTTPSGSPIDEDSVKVVTQPPNGSVVCFGDSAAGLGAGECKYTPNPTFKGTDTYTYQVCNTADPVECDTTTVTVAVGEPPVIVADDDSGVTAIGVPLKTPVLANDVAVGGELDPETVTLVGSAPTDTTVSCESGYCTLTASKPGTYKYLYEVCMVDPAAACDTAEVTVVVAADDPGNPGNPAPTIVASPDSDTTPKDTPVTTTVVQNDGAVGGVLDPASVTPVGSTSASGGSIAKEGDGKIKYTPRAGFVGTDTYQYQVCLVAPEDTCTTTTVSIKVGDPAITAKDDTATWNEPKNVTTNDVPTGGELDKSSVKEVGTPPAHGKVDCTDGVCTYTPDDPSDPQEDEYTYQVCLVSPQEVCSTAKVTVGKPAPVAPVAVPVDNPFALLMLVLGLLGLGSRYARKRVA